MAPELSINTPSEGPAGVGAFELRQTEREIGTGQEFQQHLRLRSIVLAECSCKCSGADPGPDSQVVLHSGRESSGILSGASYVANVTITLQATCVKTEVDFFEMSASFRLEYEVHPEFTPTDEHLKAFAEGNAVFNCWPYAREFFQNMGQRMGLIFPPLPLLRFTATQESAAAPAARKRSTRKKLS